jgi:hypothetical protein
MAERRMFAKTIVDSDAFLDMPQSTQNLYFHLCMRADDDGFLNNPKKIQRTVNCSDDDAKILCAKNFIIPFDSGIIVIKHWRIHNYLRSDRYKPTVYQEERAQLDIKDNGAYTCKSGIPTVNQCETQVRLGKESIGKESKKDASASSTPRFQKPSLEQVQEYCQERGNKVDLDKWFAFYDSNGWKVGKNPMKDWKGAIRTWEPDGFRAKSQIKKELCQKCGEPLYDGNCVNIDCK